MARKTTRGGRGGRPAHDSQAAPDHWIQGAVKEPGSLTRIASRAGQSPMGFARAHYHDSGKVGQKARFAVNAQKRRR